jgi:predicted HTH transcriptional regulator
MTQLVDEFGFGINQLRMYFPKLQAEGYIKLADKDKFTYIYVSSKYQGNTPVLMTDYHKIKRFVYYFGKPFTAKLIVNELGIQYHTVLSRLRKMYAEGYIKFLGRDKWAKVYILNKNYGNGT